MLERLVALKSVPASPGRPGHILLLLVLLAVAVSGMALGGEEPDATTVVPPPAGTGVKAPAPARERSLLRAACEYLNLSRPQVARLLTVARSTDRRRRLLEQEESQKRAELLEKTEPKDLESREKALSARREQVVGEISKYAAPFMTRQLTREQILLCWRLTRGDPPRYAEAAPSLLDADAGFTRRGGGRTRLLLLNDASKDFVSAVLFERAREVQSRRVLDVSNPESTALDNVQRAERNRQSALILDASPETKPFPQRVVESNDLEELLPAVQPLARRLFTSPYWLAVLEELAAGGTLRESALGSTSMGSIRQVRDYQMEKGFDDQTGRGPTLQPLGGKLERGYYSFGAGQGLYLPNTGVLDHYALQFSFRAGAARSYQKLIDFKNGEKDGGLYLYQGSVTFYSLAEGGSPQPEVEHRLRLERNRKTRIVRAYLDFRPIFAFMDLDDAAVFEAGKGIFFADDRTTKNEEGPGALHWLTIYGPSKVR